ncbi:PIG-L deacetylase family protein [Ilumatobacter sp.]|uniref:PIG-L deacetylase family protein n=1 Tax=Ilumatobacter sp. TaxID=1967498 RepID=UPI003751C449
MAALIRPIEDGGGRPVLIVVAHADDVALFIGGTVAAWSAANWKVIVVRATDDRWDSVDSTESATVEANQKELTSALDVLGVAELVNLGLPTDTLGDVSSVALRERFIHAVRTYRPYALVSFDPYAMYGEDNLDHVAVARAADESFWTSQFDLHHPEHFDDGLKPHGCFERWYFGRRVMDVTDVVDISATLDRKIEAACCHRTMMLNYFNQLQLQARTGGWTIPTVDDALADARVDSVLPDFVRAGAERAGAFHGLAAAEEFRTVTFGGMHALLDAKGIRQ